MFTEPCLENYTIYTKSNCIYCEKVKELLENKKVTYINCDEYLLGEQKEEFLEFIKNKASQSYRMFPIVFYKGVFIGGYEQTKQYIENYDIIYDF